MANLDFGGAAKGAAAGATTLGSVGGPWGALAGGVLGAGAGLFGKKKKRKISTLDKNQQRLNQSQTDAMFGEGPLADLYNYDSEQANEVFDRSYADPAYRNFNEKLAPGITGQFRKQGIQDSSYSADALARTGRDIQESLNAQRGQYLYGEEKEAKGAKRGAIKDLQDRQNFAYDKNSTGDFDIDSILEKFTPEVMGQMKKYFDSLRGI